VVFHTTVTSVTNQNLEKINYGLQELFF